MSDPLGTGIVAGCELPPGCWERNTGGLEEQPVPLTAEPFLQTFGIIFLKTLIGYTV